VGGRTGARTEAPRSRWADGPKSTLRDYAETILVCSLVFVFLRAFVLQQSEIPSGSMEDTVLPGDYILVNRFVFGPTATGWERDLLPVRDIDRGDLVVFMHPDEPERDFIKRVIGLPGETVEVREGQVRIDGRTLDEPYVNPLYRSRQSHAAVQVPHGEYFVLGDHRNNSADSRVWGTVPRDLIKGRAFLVLLSTSAPQVRGEEAGRVTVGSTLRKFWHIAVHGRWGRAFRLIR
jgi:signal peptidase I